MPSPHLEKGDMAIIANCLEDIRQRKKQKGSEPKLHRGREGGEKSEKLSRQWLLPTQFLQRLV